MKKKISILGSTGSIGLSTLKIVEKKKNNFSVNLLVANKNFNIISKQIKKYKPSYFIVRDKNTFNKIKKKFNKNKTIILNNFLKEMNFVSDITVAAIPGISGLEPTLKAVKFSKKILIANKEAIICGWRLLKKEALNFKTKIIPIDSEHFSIFKLLEYEKKEEIKKIYITASGGPFLNYNKKQLQKIKPVDALKHPKWKMGKKISVDSSTLMNKILELSEAQKIFNFENQKLSIVIHPESLVHAIIELKNGLVKFIYHETSMIIPILNAIYEKNLDIDKFFKKKNSQVLKNITFKNVNKQIFPVIKLKNKINEFESSSIIINAANEVAVEQFLGKKLSFLKIHKTIMSILNDRNYKKYAIKKPKNIKEIIMIDNWARETTLKRLNK